MTENHCEYSFPDIWKKVDSDDPDRDRLKTANDLHGRIYRAARYLLVKDFCASAQIPESPQEFPGNRGVLSDSQIAQMVAVHGILLADGWEPSMGKSQPGGDDLMLPAHEGGGHPMVIDRRFIDAVVAAVQEYTSAAKLYDACFTFLKNQGQPATVAKVQKSS